MQKQKPTDQQVKPKTNPCKHKQLKRKKEQEDPKMDLVFGKMKKQKWLHQWLQVKPKDKSMKQQN